MVLALVRKEAVRKLVRTESAVSAALVSAEVSALLMARIGFCFRAVSTETVNHMTDTTKQRVTGQNREIILKVITDLTEHGHQASRRRIVEVTGLSMGIVDDHISRLREDGVIRSLYAGLFELVDTTPDRAVSVTALPRGQLKVEVGDDVCEALTPREALALAKLLAGVVLAFGAGR